MITKNKLLQFNLETLDHYFARLVTALQSGQLTTARDMVEELSERQAMKLAEWSRTIRDNETRNRLLTLIIELK